MCNVLTHPSHLPHVVYTVPALVCGNPGFSDGGITSTWSYIHTGGLSLDHVYVSYTFEEGSVTSSPILVMTFMNAQPTEVNVPRLVAGRRYTFNITAENDVGSSYILCGPTFLSIGKSSTHVLMQLADSMSIYLVHVCQNYVISLTTGQPALPQFGDLMSGPQEGEVTIQIKTVASGIDSNSTSWQFQFNIVPVLSGVEGEKREFVRNDYVSGTFEIVTITDLEPGKSYAFSATAVNCFGTSETAHSAFVTAGMGVRAEVY